jgi:hypothetical protein
MQRSTGRCRALKASAESFNQNHLLQINASKASCWFETSLL